MIDEGPFNTADTFELARAVRRGETLQWFDTQQGQWMTPRDRETMLRILRDDPTRTYRLVAAGVGAPAECCHQTMPLGTRCEGCPLAKPGDKLVPRRNGGVAAGGKTVGGGM